MDLHIFHKLFNKWLVSFLKVDVIVDQVTCQCVASLVRMFLQWIGFFLWKSRNLTFNAVISLIPSFASQPFVIVVSPVISIVFCNSLAPGWSCSRSTCPLERWYLCRRWSPRRPWRNGSLTIYTATGVFPPSLLPGSTSSQMPSRQGSLRKEITVVPEIFVSKYFVIYKFQLKLILENSIVQNLIMLLYY